MRVWFRADASSTLGHGHVMRCLTLADALRERDAVVSFVCRDLPGNLCALIERRGFGVARLSGQCSWEEDVAGTRSAIEADDSSADWIVVDHYQLDRRWQHALRASTRRVMVIDDLANRPHDCDLLLDQNLLQGMNVRYQPHVPATARLLLGPKYALIRPEYAALRDQVLPRAGSVGRILVSFGGADVTDVTGRTVSAFVALHRDDVVLEVVSVGAKDVTERLRERVRHRKNIRISDGVSSLAPLIAQADLAVGAGGATTWERLCLGLPSIVVTLAENQRPIAEALNAEGLVRWIGDDADVSDAMIARAINDVLLAGLDGSWSRQCAAVVDGLGVNRVRDAMTGADVLPFTVRSIRSSDESLLLTWANDPETRANAFSPSLIAADGHKAWFSARLQQAIVCRFYIVETATGIPAGQVRFEQEGSVWQVHYALGPSFRRLGLGLALLKSALAQFRDDVGDAVIYGKVQESNRASRRIFETLGFAMQVGAVPGVIEYNLTQQCITNTL